MPDYQRALIVGAGAGLSASLARLLSRNGMAVALAARDTVKLRDLAAETGAKTLSCDVSIPDEVAKLFAMLDVDMGAPDVVIFNASGRVRGPFAELDPDEVRKALMISAYGGYLVAREAVLRMESAGHGAILFTGASASVKGYARSAPFAMGKFALRGLSQSLARELQPKGIHVAHFVIDGGIRSPRRPEPADAPDSLLSPDAIAETYLAVLNQHRSAWTSEVELRPWVEKF
jgi:NAD(P)-dependent dehydrogenase (short-subunit alcohol dehydrogenase family)